MSDFSGFIEQILRLVDVVGVEHVGIGTDMDANFRPVFDHYSKWPLIPAALLKWGMNESETALVMGGNYDRIFTANRHYVRKG